MKRTAPPLLITFTVLSLSGCSISDLVLGGMLSSAGDGIATVYLSEDDPDLVRESLPTNMKLIELLIQKSPNNPTLLTSACQAFTVYAYAFVLRDAEIAMDEDFAAARRLTSRAKKLLRRARDYGIAALEAVHPGFEEAYFLDQRSALQKATAEDLSALYWTAAAWGLYISASKDNPAAIIELPNIGYFLERALELDEDYDNGSLHDLMFTYTLSRPDGGSAAPIQSKLFSLDAKVTDAKGIAKKHFDRAMELSGGSRASLYVSYAESVSVLNQNRGEFLEMLEKAEGVDVNGIPNQRLANIIAQERAGWLKNRVDELFF
jgi:predicted anti-sigma-YlaC factor YlaD